MTDFTGAVAPDLETFRSLARDRRVIPVVRRLLADGITAVGLFEAPVRRPRRHLPPRVGRAGPQLVAVLLHRRALRRDAHPARRRGRVAGPRARGACRGRQRRRGAARHRRPAAHHAAAGPAPADRRPGRATSPTTPSGRGSACPTTTPTSSASPTSASCWRPISPSSTTRTARCCSSPTPSTTTPPTSGSTTRGPTPSRGSIGCRSSSPRRWPSASRRTTPTAPIEVRASHAREDVPVAGRGGQGVHPRRRRLPDRAVPALLRALQRRRPSTSTGSCGRRTPAPTCT